MHSLRILLFLLFILSVKTNFVLGQNLSDYFTLNQIEKANTAKDISYLSLEEKAVYTWLNLARMYPSTFAAVLKEYAFANGLKESSYAKSLYKTLLNNTKPMEPVYPSDRLREYAECHAINSGKLGYVGHNRAQTLCKKMNFGYGECCAYGSAYGREIVFQLLIDDRVPSLGHRKICLDSNYTAMGVAIRPHRTYRFNAVLDFNYNQ